MDSNKIEGLLGLCMKSGGLVFGSEACIEGIEKKKVKLILVAEDAADRTKKNFTFHCNQNHIPICFYGKIENLSKAIGKPNKAIFGIRNQSFAFEIEKIINGGDVIG